MIWLKSLNPYSTGRWFLIANWLPYLKSDNRGVLILILLEDGFWSMVFFANPKLNGLKVLILILLEDGFWSSAL